MVERGPEKAGVGSSILLLGTIKIRDGSIFYLGNAPKNNCPLFLLKDLKVLLNKIGGRFYFC